MLILAHGFHLQKVRQIHKDSQICYTLAVKLHLECENIYKAVVSGIGRLLARRSWIAGAGLAGRTGITSAAIKKRSLGGEFPLGKRGSPLIRPTKIKGLTAHAVISGIGRMLAQRT